MNYGIQAARSEVFRDVLSSDERCKAPAGDSISLPDLSHQQLSLFLAFLYTGNLLDGDQEEEHHLHALLVAGDKYDVPFLRRACEAATEPVETRWVEAPRWCEPITGRASLTRSRHAGRGFAGSPAPLARPPSTRD